MMEDWDPFGGDDEPFPDTPVGRRGAAYYAVTSRGLAFPATLIDPSQWGLITALKAQPLRVMRKASSLLAMDIPSEDVLRQLRLLPPGTPIERMCAAAAIIAQDTQDEDSEGNDNERNSNDG